MRRAGSLLGGIALGIVFGTQFFEPVPHTEFIKVPLPPKVTTQKVVEERVIKEVVPIPEVCLELPERSKRLADSLNSISRQQRKIFDRLHDLDYELLENTAATREMEDWLMRELGSYDYDVYQVFKLDYDFQVASQACERELEEREE